MRVADNRAHYTRHSLTLDAAVVARAHERGINISLICREALSAAVRAAETKRAQSMTWEP